MTTTALAAGNREALDPQRRRVAARTKHEIAGGSQIQEHILEVARNRQLIDGIEDFAVFNPEAPRL